MTMKLSGLVADASIIFVISASTSSSKTSAVKANTSDSEAITASSDCPMSAETPDIAIIAVCKRRSSIISCSFVNSILSTSSPLSILLLFVISVTFIAANSVYLIANDMFYWHSLPLIIRSFASAVLVYRAYRLPLLILHFLSNVVIKIT